MTKKTPPDRLTSPRRAWVAALGLMLAPMGMVGGCSSRSSSVPSASPAMSVPPPPASSSIAAPVVSAPSLDPVLSDARLAVVARMAEAQDNAGAAQTLERLLVEAPPAHEDRLRWLYQAGRQYALAKRPADAARMFAACASDAWPLAPYAALGAAQQGLAAGRVDEAISWARAVGADAVVAPAATLTLAEAFEQKNALAEAIPLWRQALSALATGGRPPRWGEVSVKLARALSAPGPQPPTVAALEEAVALARRVAIEQPASAQARPALAVEQAALAALPPDRRAALARRPEDELTRASALLDAGKVSESEAALGEVEAASAPATRSAEVACKVASLGGKLKTRRKQREPAAEAWGEAIKRCTGEARVTALYHGGGASVSAGNNSEALARFELLEQEAPRHRLADDARLKGALAAQALGDDARFTSMLERMGEAYPEGDMTTEGLFRLALHRMGKGDWSGAVAPLEASRKLRPRERDYWAAGRADYFLARALAATGDRARAEAIYREILTDQPLSFYMAMAHARLAESNAAQATEAFQKAATPAEAAPADPTALPALPQLATPAGRRAVELLRQGEPELARAEFTAAQLTGPGAPPELQWAVASLYGKSGAMVLAHSIPRGKLSDWLEHYPAGSWRSRWELAYPRPYLETVQREAKRSGIPVSLAYAIMREESAFDPNAVSPSPAYGLMQFTLDTAKTVGKKLNLPISEATVKTPATSIALGCRYLADLRSRYPACPALAIPSYNAGPGATRRWLAQRPSEDFDLFVERIPYEETRNYTKRVLKSYLAYLYLYEPEQLGEAMRLPLRTQGAAPPAEAPEGELYGTSTLRSVTPDRRRAQRALSPGAAAGRGRRRGGLRVHLSGHGGAGGGQGVAP